VIFVGSYRQLSGPSIRKLPFAIAIVHSREQFGAIAEINSSDCKETFENQLTSAEIPKACANSCRSVTRSATLN
jgi:hypothetical protein